MKKVLCVLVAVVFLLGVCVNFSSCAIFFGIGLLHLNEMAIGLGHRVIYSNDAAKKENNYES